MTSGLLSLNLLFALLFSFLLDNPQSSGQSNHSQSQFYTAYTFSSDDWAESRLAAMTLREKIAQMIVTNSDGYSLDENSPDFQRLKNLIVNDKIGGVIFFKGNSVQEAGLINTLQSMSETPLLMSADFERGTKMRLEDGSLFPSNMALGATRNPKLAYQMGLMIARECKAIGIGQNYAPVADVNNNSKNPIINVRSFGEDPSLVSEMAVQMIKGLQDCGVIATAKHFPGHGDTEIDSHNDLPVLNFGKDRLEQTELVPFRNAVNNNVMSVMIAHLSFPAIEPEQFVPASLSKNVIDGLLLGEMKFKGLVVTDALNMAGVVKHFSVEDIGIRCAAAGVDLILMPQGEEAAIGAIEDAVNKGMIPVEKINESALKILKAKQWLKLNQNKYVDMSNVSMVVNSPEEKNLSQQIADESLTLVKNEGGAVPFASPESKTCAVISLNNGNETANSSYFQKTFGEMNKFASVKYFDLNGDVSGIDDIVSEASGYDMIVIPIYAKVKIKTGTVGLPQSQIELISKLISAGKSVTVISFGNPYLLQAFPSAGVYICAYSDAETSINAAIKSLFGTIKFKGKLPVTITDEFMFGFGLN